LEVNCAFNCPKEGVAKKENIITIKLKHTQVRLVFIDNEFQIRKWILLSYLRDFILLFGKRLKVPD